MEASPIYRKTLAEHYRHQPNGTRLEFEDTCMVTVEKIGGKWTVIGVDLKTSREGGFVVADESLAEKYPIYPLKSNPIAGGNGNSPP